MRIHGDSRARGTSRWLQPSSSPVTSLGKVSIAGVDTGFPRQGQHCEVGSVAFPEEVSTVGVDMTSPARVGLAGEEVTSRARSAPRV